MPPEGSAPAELVAAHHLADTANRLSQHADAAGRVERADVVALIRATGELLNSLSVR